MIEHLEPVGPLAAAGVAADGQTRGLGGIRREELRHVHVVAAPLHLQTGKPAWYNVLEDENCIHRQYSIAIKKIYIMRIPHSQLISTNRRQWEYGVPKWGML